MRKYAIIFDIDDTVADTSHRSNELTKRPLTASVWKAFYDKMVDDVPIQPMIEFINAVHNLSNCSHDKIKVIFVTARPEDYREVTENFLRTHLSFDDFELMMRENNNFESSMDLKKRLFKLIEQKYHVLFAIDDRTRVVNSINSTFKFPCIQFNKNDF